MELEVETGPVIGHVQTDSFCEGCGYNLNTQVVTRDPRLGILVCRCPECGRFTAAGRHTGAGRVWLNRLATGMLAFWVLGLICFFLLDSFFLGLIAYGHTIEQTQPKWQTPAGTTYPAMAYYSNYRLVVRDLPINDTDALTRFRNEQLLLDAIAATLAWVAGVTFSVFFWHSRGWRQLLAMVPAILGCGVVMILWHMDPQTQLIRSWGLMQIGWMLALEIAGTAIGILLGRRLARFVLTIFLPPKARQHLACLWTIDGKRIPVHPDQLTSAAPPDAASQTDPPNPAPTA